MNKYFLAIVANKMRYGYAKSLSFATKERQQPQQPQQQPQQQQQQQL